MGGVEWFVIASCSAVVAGQILVFLFVKFTGDLTYKRNQELLKTFVEQMNLVTRTIAYYAELSQSPGVIVPPGPTVQMKRPDGEQLPEINAAKVELIRKIRSKGGR